MTIVFVGYAEFVEQIEDRTYVLVMVDHRIVVARSALSPDCPMLSGLGVSPEVHVGVVDPDKERVSSLVLTFDEVQGPRFELVVDRLHTLFGQWSRIRAFLLAHRLPFRGSDVESSLSVATQSTTPRGPYFLANSAFFGIVGLLGLL